MNGNFLTQASGAALFKAGASAIFILFLTSVHHAYGAAIYDTPWRLHIVWISIPAAIVIAGGFYLGWRKPHTRAGWFAAWLALAVSAVFAIVLIGFYEGGYNHVLKNALYFFGGEDLTRSLYAGDLYEMPNDFIFEATGIAQLLAAVAAARFTWRLLRPAASGERRLIESPLHSTK